MSYEERKREILSELEFSRKMSFTDVEKILDVSPSTIRRDLAQMASEGFINRYHGGIKLDDAITDYSMSHKRALHAEEKRLISKCAAQQICPHELIFIGGGSTTLSMLDYLTETSVSIITNSIPHAEVLHRRGIRTFLLCGFLRERTRSLGGTEMIELMSKYHFDKCFVGAGGMSLSLDVLSADSEAQNIKKIAFAQSKKSYVLVDASKFGLTAMYATPLNNYKNITVITNCTEVAADKRVMCV